MVLSVNWDGIPYACLYLCTVLLEVMGETWDKWDRGRQSSNFYVSDNQASSLQEWLVQGAKPVTQQEQVRGKKISPASSQRDTNAPISMDHLKHQLTHPALGPSLSSELGWGSSLAFTGYEAHSYI